MRKAKSKVQTSGRIGGIATSCPGGNGTHILLPASWIGRRVFACLKEELDKEKRQQERKETAGLIAGERK